MTALRLLAYLLLALLAAAVAAVYGYVVLLIVFPRQGGSPVPAALLGGWLGG